MPHVHLDLQQVKNAKTSHCLVLKYTMLLRTLSWSILALGLASCSIYKSDGRGQFESAAPSKLQSQSVKDSTLEDLTEYQDECWIQPSDEPLWHAKSGQKLIVKTISSQTFEVCEVVP
jgi:hypothetical protein